MNDNPRGEEINMLIGMCVFGTFVIVVGLFVIGIAGHRPPAVPIDTGTTTAP
jgi:hypothetical protein